MKKRAFIFIRVNGFNTPPLKAWLLIFLLFSLCMPVFPQEETLTLMDIFEELLYTDSIFVIDAFHFSIEGRTRENALINAAELTKGQEISGISALKNYIEEKTQLLYNQRVIESASVDYSINQINEAGKYPVDIYVNIKDTNNIGIFPDPKYSTDYGFGLSLILIDNNFFGTMQPFKTKIGYQYDDLGRSNYILELEANIPLRIFGINWILYSDNEFIYRPKVSNPLFYVNTTGFYTNLHFNSVTITPGFSVSTVLNQEIFNPDKTSYSDCHSLHFGPQIMFSSIDWFDNFRNGYSISLFQSFDYYFYSKKFDMNPWGIFYGTAGIIHHNFDSFSGISSRLMFRNWTISSISHNAGDVLRGIVDKDVSADLTLSLNLDLSFKILMFRPSEWLNNKKLEIFNFDLHVNPFLDIALYRSPSITTDNIFDSLLASIGIEVVIFPYKFRSFCLRVSYGRNLTGPSASGKNELFIGGNLFY